MEIRVVVFDFCWKMSEELGNGLTCCSKTHHPNGLTSYFIALELQVRRMGTDFPLFSLQPFDRRQGMTHKCDQIGNEHFRHCLGISGRSVENRNAQFGSRLHSDIGGGAPTNSDKF